MANSKYEYVKQFELPNVLLPNTYIVVRVDGKGFHKFSEFYKFKKPNDKDALELMNKAAFMVMTSFPDIWLAYGESDEYSFVLERSSMLYNRRSDKIATMVCSAFTTAYTYFFPQLMGQPLKVPYLPVFDARCVCYPDLKTLRDYLSWRQVDCHINNLYNTCFWALVQSGVDRQKAEQRLSKTNASDKNEILFSEFKINYNEVDEIFKKGTVIVRIKKISQPELKQEEPDMNHIEISQKNEEEKLSRKQRKKLKYKEQEEKQKFESEVQEHYEIITQNVDIIKDNFWILYKDSLPLE